MVENTGTDTQDVSTIDLQFDNPNEHAEAIKQVGSKIGVDDVDKYILGQGINLIDDGINCFYGGTLEFDDDGLIYQEEGSEEHKGLVDERLSKIIGYKYTPEEVKKEVEDFYKHFKEIEGTLNSPNPWRKIINEWVDVVNRTIIKNGKYMNASSYYHTKVHDLKQKFLRNE